LLFHQKLLFFLAINKKKLKFASEMLGQLLNINLNNRTNTSVRRLPFRPLWV